MAINFPFYTYPNIATSQYYDFDIYRKNVKKLNDFINSYIPKNKTFFHLIVGAAMEEHIYKFKNNDYIDCYDYQWRQLFPYWLDTFIRNTDASVEIIIISPNEQFCNDNYQMEFIDHTNNIYDWYITDNIIKSKKYNNITITIFGTFFPHICERNANVIGYYKNTNNCIFDDVISNVKQNNNDIDFITNFYTNLIKLFDKIIDMNGFISCCSYAVFNSSTINAKLNKYVMFKELLNIIDKYPKDKIMCTEWIYMINFYCVFDMYSNELYSYVEPSKRFLDGCMPVITSSNNIRINYPKSKDYINYIKYNN